METKAEHCYKFIFREQIKKKLEMSQRGEDKKSEDVEKEEKSRKRPQRQVQKDQQKDDESESGKEESEEEEEDASSDSDSSISSPDEGLLLNWTYGNFGYGYM